MIKIFLAVLPDNNGNTPRYVDEISETKDTLVMHPAYNFDSPEGKLLIEKMGVSDLPQHNEPFIQLQARDYWLIKNCDILVYDLDSDIGYHYITAAILQNSSIRIIGVSATLRGAMPYFSGNFEGIIRPAKLLNYLGFESRSDEKEETDDQN